MGCGRIAEPVHGELVLGKTGFGSDLRPLPIGRSPARGVDGTPAPIAQFPGGDAADAAARIQPLRFPAAPGIRSRRRDQSAIADRGSARAGRGGEAAVVQSFSKRVFTYFRRRL